MSDGSTSLLRACYVADTSRVVKLSYPARETLGIWPVPENEWINDFDVDSRTGLVYAATMTERPQSPLWPNSVRVCSKGSPSRVIWADSTTEYLAFYRILLSPSGTHAALQACIFLEFHYLVIVDLRSGVATPYYCTDVDHKEAVPLAWDASGTHLYARRSDWWSSDLVVVDIGARTWRPLTSHDIRDYVPDQQLLAQGVSPGGCRYAELIGDAHPGTVEWSPDGRAFVYADERWGECCLVYDVATRAKDVVAVGPLAPYRLCPVVHGDWNAGPWGGVPDGACTTYVAPLSLTPAFVDTVSALNSCASYRVVCSAVPPPALQLSWNCPALADSLPRAHYVFRGRVDHEIAHLAELDYVLRMLGGGVRSRIFQYSPWWRYAGSDPPWTMQQLADSAHTYLEALDTLRRAYCDLAYPEVLAGEKPLIDSVATLQYRFEVCLTQYVESSDIAALKDSLARLFPLPQSLWLQEDADRMAATTYRDRLGEFQKRALRYCLIPALSVIDSTMARYRSLYRVEPTYYEQTQYAYWAYSLDSCR